MIDDLAAARFERKDDPSECTIDEVFAAARKHIAERGVDHVIIVYGKREPQPDSAGACCHSYTQGGSFNHLEQIGLLAQVQSDMMSR